MVKRQYMKKDFGDRQRRDHRAEQARKDNLPQSPTLKDILKAVIEAHDISMIDFNRHLNTRKRDHVAIRQWFCWMAVRYFFTTSDTGKMIDKDHSTVIYSAAKVEDLMAAYPSMKETRTRIFQHLRKNLSPKTLHHVSSLPGHYRPLWGGSGRIPYRSKKASGIASHLGSLYGF